VVRKTSGGQLAIKFSDLVTNKCISISEKHGKLVTSESNLVTLATPAVTMSTFVTVMSHSKKYQKKSDLARLFKSGLVNPFYHRSQLLEFNFCNSLFVNFIVVL